MRFRFHNRNNTSLRPPYLPLSRLVSTLGILVAILLACGLSSEPAQADQRYKIYKTDPFGIPEDSLSPSAIVEIDEESGHGTIYKTDSIGNPDIIAGPQYIIEPESPPSRRRSIEIDEPCDDDLRRHRHRRARGIGRSESPWWDE